MVAQVSVTCSHLTLGRAYGCSWCVMLRDADSSVHEKGDGVSASWLLYAADDILAFFADGKQKPRCVPLAFVVLRGDRVPSLCTLLLFTRLHP